MLIGITGKLGSGKSTLLKFFKNKGCKTYDADKIVAKLLKNKSIKAEIEKQFGKNVFKKGKIDKRILSKTVFKDKKKLLRLNKIIHPHVKKIIKQIRHEKKLVFVEVPLLFETRMEKLFDKTILMIVKNKTRLKRLKKKGFKELEIKARLKFQMKEKEAIKKAYYVLRNDFSIKKTLIKANSFYYSIKKELNA